MIIVRSLASFISNVIIVIIYYNFLDILLMVLWACILLANAAFVGRMSLGYLQMSDGF